MVTDVLVRSFMNHGTNRSELKSEHTIHQITSKVKKNIVGDYFVSSCENTLLPKPFEAFINIKVSSLVKKYETKITLVKLIEIS